MDFYNNPAKPCTPPLILLWDIYWLFKKILLTVCGWLNFLCNWSFLKFVFKSQNSNAEILHPRVLGQHPLRLPPDYMPVSSYKEIFEHTSKLERQVLKEMQVRNSSQEARVSSNLLIGGRGRSSRPNRGANQTAAIPCPNTQQSDENDHSAWWRWCGFIINL